MNKTEVIRRVKGRLANVGHGITFEVVDAGVRREDAWWYVPVVAARNGKDVPRELTVNIFANVEDRLEQDEKMNVLLIPAIPEAAVAEGKRSGGGKRRSTSAPR